MDSTEYYANTTEQTDYSLYLGFKKAQNFRNQHMESKHICVHLNAASY